ncbi:hypothetical protein DC094_10485 [Pelagibaculum spongiae]|uniref:Uncharacterized protein n=1 Tax=Pelagibaculum spongiae TaxID=2080658 RepID=A0A2V1GXJ4_9GAMM|nr:hypothetical protein DC094_10485 [Pelagibaculum spongiae]
MLGFFISMDGMYGARRQEADAYIYEV